MLTWLATHGLSIGVALAVGAVFAIVGLSRQAPPPIEVRPRDPLPTPVVLVYVHVDGAVVSPGVYALPSGARIFEAIAAAGGPTDDADARELNLAARVADGQKLVVPALAPVAELGDQASTPVSAAPVATVPAAAGPRININTASQRILETLPGIGPVTAGRIIEYRQANGPFTRIEQLRDSRLVNAAIFERIRNLVSVE
jgi:competence protein ComEA